MVRAIFMILSMIVSIYAINRQVYKIVLTQKGYAQFLQYDVVTPPLREFTFCTWIRVYDLAEDQSIFTYVVNGNNRVIRLWLDSGGKHMKVSINGKVTSDVVVEMMKDVWRHVCLSYQSDFGSWSLYIDSRLASCEAAASLRGFVMPEGGSVIIGYGTADNGASNGFEGEIFGANMILSSTIERNFTMKADPIHSQKRFPRNKLKHDSQYANYVVLSDLLNNEIHNNFEKTNISQGFTTKNYNIHESYEFEEHDSNEDHSSTKRPQKIATSASQEDFNFTSLDFSTNNKEKIEFWNSNGNPRFTFADVYKAQATRPTATTLLNSSTKLTPILSEYETPPPPSQNIHFYNTQDTTHTPQSIYNLSNGTTSQERQKFKKPPVTQLSEIETPPPADQNTKVYGQWTSSKFAGTVLNYLKSINFKNREHFLRRVPQTIPLHKISDSHPYPSEFRLHIQRPLSHFKNRKVVEKRFDIIRRDPLINVQVLEDDPRLNILKMHAETQTKKVEIRSHGEPKEHVEHRYYRNINYDGKKTGREAISLEDYQPTPFVLKEERKGNHKYFVQPTPVKTRTSKLPFLKSLEYLMKSSDSSHIQVDDSVQDTYAKNLSHKNMWHNAKSYSNDYTPRKLNMDYSDVLDNRGKLYPSIRLKYNPHPQKSNKKDLHKDVDPFLLRARKLATEVSNQSFIQPGSVSISKYNHKDFPVQKELTQEKPKSDGDIKKRYPHKRNMKATNFDQHIKIGNALNERLVTDVDVEHVEHNKKSFLGRKENIPDINKYRLELNNEHVKLAPSRGTRVCKNVELYDRVLYVQPDESIDLTHILSPLRERNIAIEFIMQNYKKCSLTDSSFQKNVMLLIDWNKTPVRLFGGAYARTTTDLCGFF